MGREFRILAAAMRWPDLLAQLEGRAVEFISPRAPQGSARRQEDVSCSHVTVTAIERDGKACVSGLPLRLAGGHDPDLVCEIAATSGRLVVGCSVNVEKGECDLVVADGDGLRRCYHHRRHTLSRPFEWGEPMPTEDEYPLNGDDDPLGLKMALRYCGFAAEEPTPDGEAQAFSCQIYPRSAGDYVPGPLGRAIMGHTDWYGVPDEEALSHAAPVTTEAAPEALRVSQTARARRRVVRFYTWMSACRPPLLHRGTLGPSSMPGKGAARWIPGRELS